MITCPKAMERTAVLVVLCGLAVTACGCRVTPVPPPQPPRPIVLEPDPPERYIVHSVRPGDTLFSLGTRFGVPWQEIQRHNEGLNARELRVGDVLFIPARSEASDAGHPMPRTGAERPEAPLPPQYNGRLVGAEGAVGAGAWIWPLQGRLVREYGDRLEGMPEAGVAIQAASGRRVRAVADGHVLCVLRRRSGWGHVVVVQHRDRMVSWYAWLDTINVREGAHVRRGDPIGSPGRHSQYQIAFRLFQNERPVNPDRFLP